MSFNLLILFLFLFVLIPVLVKRFNLDPDKKIPEFLNEASAQIPQIESNWQSIFIKIAFAFAIFMEYISLKYEDLSYTPLLAHTLSLLIFAYVGYLLSDELFDTHWNSAITLISFFFVFNLFSGIINFIFVETDWTIIWMNRRTLIVGPNFISQFGGEIWRLWPPFYLLTILVGSAYGSLGEARGKFLIPYSIFSIATILFLHYDADYDSASKGGLVTNRGFDDGKALLLLIGGLGLGGISFLLSNKYYKDAEEYRINYFQNTLINTAVIGFIGMIFILDPPGESTDDYFWNSEGLLGTGVKPAAWGGLVLNLIFASAALVVGFGIGIALAFGRRSNLPVFWIPSVGVIEVIRSGPLVAWLFFAQILVPDLLDPVWEADIASRVILVLSLFFGCYLAEVLRGGLQAVPHGQYEAATALGLSPIQTKLQIELPQAIRTTLPAIVSMMIGMLKDTSLVYFFGIYDAFRVAKDLPAQWDFIGQHEQSLLFVGMIFWTLSFYLSKVSKRIEKNLGLTHEGGGEAT